MSNHKYKPSIPNKLFIALLLLVTYAAAMLAMVAPLFTPLSSAPAQVGQVALQDFQAPRPMSFQSKWLTEEQQNIAASLVQPVFSSPDTTVARNQLEKLRASITYISSVRADPLSSLEQKTLDLAALESIQMNEQLAQSILSLTDSQWQAVYQEAIVVLEQVMRNAIRDENLPALRYNLSAKVSLSLPDEQVVIVTKLVDAFVVPNVFYSAELTEEARLQARQVVSPVTRSFKAGETIVQGGTVITATDLEALEAAGLAHPQYNWRELTSLAILVFLVILFASLYLRRNEALIQDSRTLTLIVILFLVFLVAARLLIPGHTLIPFIFPIAAFGMTVAVFIGTDTALISSFILSILVAFGLPSAFEIASFYILSTFFGILTLGKAHRVMSFLLAGAAIAGSGTLVALIFRFPEPTTDMVGLLSIAGASLLNGFVSAGLTILMQYLLAQALGMTTALQLLEISRPDHPLLQYLLRNAPGTYQHSLQVANLAEQAAERIGGDALLTRVGALYHDIGKAKKPVFYIENQVAEHVNPHDDLDPETSSQTVISHVLEGLELARKYRLPKRIQDFIVEHHGTMITRYQYAKALKNANGDDRRVDEEKFRYPGPSPLSKETAILMLADGCEARVRAESPKDEAELREIIKSVVDHRLSQGQLDYTDLTLKDLSDLIDSFTTTLRGVYHPRIEYPKLEKNEPLPSDATPLITTTINPVPENIQQSGVDLSKP